MEQPQQPPSPTTPFTPISPTTTISSSTTSTTNTTNDRTTRPLLTLSTTQNSKLSPTFLAKLQHLSTPLHPLVQITTGQIHPSFPRTLLAFWLLTDAELDDLAHFYHQRTPGPWTGQYPCPVPWRKEGRAMSTEQKRRRFGRFIGLRGCESPVEDGRHMDGDGDVEMMTMVSEEVREMVGRRSEEEIWAAARRERESEDEVEEVRRKMGWYY
ncbi:hypothetical protein VTJ04DRAFT_2932 [Mycothermus thermophilus]|uniref:uncharacterized protein n=1 Tax=Humicola insolens TaxID=85995 RepID=UPI003744957E